jgi:hypothetical protein
MSRETGKKRRAALPAQRAGSGCELRGICRALLMLRQAA